MTETQEKRRTLSDEVQGGQATDQTGLNALEMNLDPTLRIMKTQVSVLSRRVFPCPLSNINPHFFKYTPTRRARLGPIKTRHQGL